jgi:hypothetical protein
LAAVIATMVVLGTLDWWHADDEDSSQPVIHDHAAHHLRIRSQPTATRTNDHCYLCHWLRTLGNGLRSASPQRLATTARVRICRVASSQTQDRLAARLPARAPPASL